jgi:hypothetical protein
MGGGASTATGCVESAGKNFFPFHGSSASPQTILPFSNKYLMRIEVKGRQLIGACNFYFNDESSTFCGGSGGEEDKVDEVFILCPNEHISRVYFCQNSTCNKPQLCGIQFETNTSRKSKPYLFSEDVWQKSNGLVAQSESQMNWVYTATSGHKIVGYNVSREWGDFGCPVITNFIEEPVRAVDSIFNNDLWYTPFVDAPTVLGPCWQRFVQYRYTCRGVQWPHPVLHFWIQ